MSLPPYGWEIPKEIHPTEEGATVGPNYLTIGASGGPGLLDHCQARIPGVRPGDESAGRCPFPEGGKGPGGVGQPEPPRARGVVRGVHAGRGTADRDAAGVPLP